MTAKEYLKQIKALDIKIQMREEESAMLKAQAEGNSSQSMNPDKVQTSISGDPMGDKLVEAADIDAEVQWLKNKLIAERHRIIGEIEQIRDARYVELLQLKYVGRLEGKKVHYMRLEEIACTMTKSNGDPYSYDHIASMHGEALQEFSRIILKSHGNPK